MAHFIHFNPWNVIRFSPMLSDFDYSSFWCEWFCNYFQVSKIKYTRKYYVCFNTDYMWYIQSETKVNSRQLQNVKWFVANIFFCCFKMHLQHLYFSREKTPPTPASPQNNPPVVEKTPWTSGTMDLDLANEGKPQGGLHNWGNWWYFFKPTFLGLKNSS